MLDAPGFVPFPAQRLFLNPFPLQNFSMKVSDLLHEPDVWLLPESCLSSSAHMSPCIATVSPS